jgi:hypothetical protein
MKLGTLLSVTALIALLFGLSFTLAPYPSLAMYGIADVTPAHRYSIQWFGVMLLAIAALDWAARHAPDSEARRAIVLGNLVSASLGLLLALVGVLQGTVNAMGWLSVAIYAALALGFLRAQRARGAEVAPATA